MPRKLKSDVTSLGFFDQAIAAPSMKAALAAWGVDSNLFHQGFAKETNDPEVIAATMAHPGIVLKRPSDQASRRSTLDVVGAPMPPLRQKLLAFLEVIQLTT